MEEMEMPTPCNNCNKIFDLNDGHGSEKWFSNMTICSDCSEIERQEIERDDEIEDLKSIIDDAKVTISDAIDRLAELGYKF